MLEARRATSPAGEERIREAFQYAASGMAIADLAGNFLLSNPAYARMVGRTEQELRQESILSITHQDERDACRCRLAQLISGEVPSFVIEKRYVRPMGDAVWVRNSFSLLQEEDEFAARIILVCNDISERRRAERLLLERERLATVGQLASSIAHEINNPLEAVLNLLYLSKEAKTLKEAREFTAQAETEVEHIAEIATQTLRFRKEQTKPVLASVSELLESVLLLFKGKLAEAHVLPGGDPAGVRKPGPQCDRCDARRRRSAGAGSGQHELAHRRRGGKDHRGRHGTRHQRRDAPAHL